ncbi:hypothetical protein ABIB62_002816 [Mucilaginibacter sp. UYP25]|uniref:hypothetical protein n=1 Tax=unclassified Mucilaginibacter TaxID=2617802 RepID=UPI003399B7F2
MKKFIVFCLLFFIVTCASAQKVCNCSANKNWSEGISCKDIILKNKSKLYWQFNCDSSWLTFQNKLGEKKIIYSLELVGYTGRLGYSYATEYKAGFLIQNNLISGCCTPPEYILYSKMTGKEIINLGPLIYYSVRYNDPLIVSYNTDALVVYNIETKKRMKIDLPKGVVAWTLKAGELPEPEYLFDAKLIGSVLIIKYRYLKIKTKDTWLNTIVKIDLTKYKS